MEIFVLNFRYLTAVGISLVLHTALIWSVPEKKAFAMPTGSQSSQVNIKFVTPSAPAPAKTKKSDVTKSDSHKPQTKKTIKKPVQKTIAKKKPVTQKPKPKKEIAKKHAVAKTIERKEPKIKKETLKEKVKKTEAKPVASKSGVTEKPQLIKKPNFLKRPDAPRYPRIAQRKGIEGTALYEIWLNENGKQIKQQLITSSGASVLDEAALNAIRDWKFSPQVINGQAIAHRVQIPVRFSLN